MKKMWAVEIAYYNNGNFMWDEVNYILAYTKEEAERIVQETRCYCANNHMEIVTGNTICCE